MEKSLGEDHKPIKKGLLWNHIAAFSKQNVTMSITHKSSTRKKRKGKRGKGGLPPYTWIFYIKETVKGEIQRKNAPGRKQENKRLRLCQGYKAFLFLTPTANRTSIHERPLCVPAIYSTAVYIEKKRRASSNKLNTSHSLFQKETKAALL